MAEFRKTNHPAIAGFLLPFLAAGAAAALVLMGKGSFESLGYTLAYLIRALAARQPASLKTCVLVHKPEQREVYAQIDYLGFEIPDAWVVGCGLDWAEKYRTLPYIGVVKPEE